MIRAVASLIVLEETASYVIGVVVTLLDAVSPIVAFTKKGITLINDLVSFNVEQHQVYE